MNNLTASKRAITHCWTFWIVQETGTHFSQRGLKARDVTLNLMTLNTRSPGQVVQSPAAKVIGHTQSCGCMPSWNHTIIVMNTWTFCTEGTKKQATFCTAFEHLEKKLAACLLHNIDIAVVSEYLCHLKTHYLKQSPNICRGKPILHFVHLVLATERPCVLRSSLTRYTNSFAAVENNFM